MKSIFLSLLFILCYSKFVFAGDVTFAWDPNSEPDLAGYRFYQGTTTRTYNNGVDVKNVTKWTVSIPNDGIKRFFAVTAYDTSDNESDYSKELTVTPPDKLPPKEPTSTP